MAKTSSNHMAVSGTYHLPSLSCSARDTQKRLTLNGIFWRVFWKKSQGNGPLEEKRKEKK